MVEWELVLFVPVVPTTIVLGVTLTCAQIGQKLRGKMMTEDNDKVEGQQSEFVSVEERTSNGKTVKLCAQTTCSFLFHRNAILKRAENEIDELSNRVGASNPAQARFSLGGASKN